MARRDFTSSVHKRAACAVAVSVIRETHETPEAVAQRLARAGGVNRFGESNYRAVWGWNRLAWIGGNFEERDPETGSLLREVAELRQEPKYPAVNRWHIERWVPPEVYGSPRAWYALTVEIADGRSIPALGPYPSRGDYEHCFTLAGPRGEFVQLTPTIAEHIARAIEWSRCQPRVSRRHAIDERAHRDDREFDARAFDLLDDHAPAFHQQSFVTVQ
jgi:hypothetical protein